ncbi:D-alanyl-D-alanine carboxypeptidase [Bacillus aquiflavi]|uniref:D-alanyl-D-alanine carboxypeptidase family protein n=1 Tax=Bacillus aquiflavi TaxID=2672567 RepID=UPI001CA815C3|nr:D-alanyl-D-alanine carboxypeptidase family protein [Bacillus aquiflavi]UAC47137.1 D-alanyl-D-alanine carboxypeptidase [Bacillus aquiflavi]
MKRIITFFLIFFIIFLIGVPVSFAEEKGSGAQLVENATSAILIERDTGTVLYEKNSDEKLPPASMTKIMTMLLIMEAIDEGKLSMNEKIRTSERAASMGGSQIFLEAGEEMTTEEMLQGIAIASGNDASVAMAERLAGSEEAFTEMMNKKAKELGLKNTFFQNSTGLPADKHYSSARDMAIMAKELLKYEEITKFTGTYESYLREDTDDKFWLVNTNRLVRFYPGVDGLKTGFTKEAKYCLNATAERDGMRVIAVVFGSPTSKDRNAQITKMLDYAFGLYKTHPMYKRNHPVGKVSVSKGKKKTVEAVTSEPISLLTKKGEDIKNIEEEISVQGHVNAPIKKTDKVGTITFKKDGKVLLESSLIAKEEIKKANWWELFKRSLGMFTRPGE